ncbi:outer membrane lipoprotein carrier protein LolA [Sphingobacterium sp. UT-1RO-CII-1]|uniref:LolA family protein n=1 Tax=Sphingobacterium sp. UT-1RO-CII-1 TaxID=2995225 RepID=UPI00227B6A63|nr:outer membrane lipoprotein carrier protein LolA [Sphingobacterium sp. UT-1RO-CII-1]MCY4778034.1 outer membrane lipoprotein carrier protein LolA [Sphingobacterium sp. UT-1RO-CII-1]
MNKQLFLSLLLVLSSCLFSIAQTDTHAKNVLDKVSKKYDSYKVIQSDFTFTAKDIDSDPYTDKGILYLNKNENKYKIQLDHQEIISDGKNVWSISKETKEVQITEAENNTDAIGPTNLFTFYKKGFKYISMENETDNKEVLQVIELSPIDTKVNYFKIKLRINKNNHIHDVTIFDKSGARYTYKINTLYVNHIIPSSYFSFQNNTYQDYEIVDLR